MSFNIGDMIVSSSRIGIIVAKHNPHCLKYQPSFKVLWNRGSSSSRLIEIYSELLLQGISINTFRK